MNKNKLLLKIFVFALFLYVPFFTHAQFGSTEVVLFTVDPEYPRPYQNVTVTIESFSIDLDRADMITWYLNGNVLMRGTGIKEVQFQTGGLGSRSVVSVAISGTKLGIVQSSITIIPTEVDILWEADTYTPPFYSGKSLPSSDADLVFVAIPQFVRSNGRKFRSDELIFKWKKDWKVLGNQSGRGRDTLKITGPKISLSTKIQVNVSSVDGVFTGEGVVEVLSVPPKLLFYENDAILGMKYENAIVDTVDLTNEEVRITAHPYFMSVKERTSLDLEYEWGVNGSRVGGAPDDKSSLTLRQVGGGEGRADILLSIQNIDKILQTARSRFSVLFSGVKTDAPFTF